MELFKPEFGLVFWMFIAFLCLFLILARFAWPYIIKSMDERADLIDKGVAYAQEAKAQLDNARNDADKLLADARNEQAALLSEAKRMRIELIDKAKKEADQEGQSRRKANEEAIKQEMDRREHELRQQMSDIALQVAEKVLRKNVANDEQQRELADRYLKEVTDAEKQTQS